MGDGRGEDPALRALSRPCRGLARQRLSDVGRAPRARCSLPAGHPGGRRCDEYIIVPFSKEELAAQELAQRIIENAQELNEGWDRETDRYDRIVTAGGGGGCCPCRPREVDGHMVGSGCWKNPDCRCMARFDRKTLLPDLPYVRRLVEPQPGPETWTRYAQPERDDIKATVYGDQSDLPEQLRMASEYKGWSRRDSKPDHRGPRYPDRRAGGVYEFAGDTAGDRWVYKPPPPGAGDRWAAECDARMAARRAEIKQGTQIAARVSFTGPGDDGRTSAPTGACR